MKKKNNPPPPRNCFCVSAGRGKKSKIMKKFARIGKNQKKKKKTRQQPDSTDVGPKRTDSTEKYEIKKEKHTTANYIVILYSVRVTAT